MPNAGSLTQCIFYIGISEYCQPMMQQQGQQPSTEDEFYLKWGYETVKNNIKFSNEILKQIITLSTTLLAASIIFEYIIPYTWVKILVLLSFFISLVTAFVGVLPFERSVDLNSPSDIKRHKRAALKHKRWYLWISAGMLIIGFIAILAVLIVRLLKL